MCVTYCEIVASGNALQMFNEASLKVATSTRLHCSVHQTLQQGQCEGHRGAECTTAHLATSHAVEEVFLRSDSTEKSSINKPTSSGTGVVSEE